jgi:hypothetical protein
MSTSYSNTSLMSGVANKAKRNALFSFDGRIAGPDSNPWVIGVRLRAVLQEGKHAGHLHGQSDRACARQRVKGMMARASCVPGTQNTKASWGGCGTWMKVSVPRGRTATFS